jgi:hypothetical protein
MNNLGKNTKSSRTARSDDIEIKFYKDDETKEPMMEGHGSWLSHLIIDNQVLWRIEDEENKVEWK